MFDEKRLEQYMQSGYSTEKAGLLENPKSYFFAPWLFSQVVANESGIERAINASFYLDIGDLEKDSYSEENIAK